MSEQETPKTENPQADDADDKKTTNTEVGKSEEKPEEKQESLLVGEDTPEETPESEPEPIEYDVEMPDEAVITEESIESLVEFAKENKLSNEIAQKLAERENEAVKGWYASQREDFAKLQEGWVKEARNDKEFGRDSFDETCKGVQGLIAKYGDEQFKTDLKSSGFENHAGLWKFLARIAKEHKEDVIASADASTSAREVPTSQKLYPDMYKGS